MTELNVALISAVTGSISAAVLIWTKEYLSISKKQKSALIEICYWLKRYQKDIKNTHEWYLNTKKNFDDIFRTKTDLNLNEELSPEYKESLRYGQFFTEDIESAVGLKSNIEDLNFLALKDQKLLDSILLSKAQYTKIIRLINQRNEIIQKFEEKCSQTRNEAEFLYVINSSQSLIVAITQELLKTLDHAQEDLSNAVRYVELKLNNCWFCRFLC